MARACSTARSVLAVVGTFTTVLYVLLVPKAMQWRSHDAYPVSTWVLYTAAVTLLYISILLVAIAVVDQVCFNEEVREATENSVK